MSPLRNRVTPFGELIADPARGLVFGNRGRLHDPTGRVLRGHDGKRWIACRLEFRGRHRLPMPPGRYTGLFFLDEATAFAAGHRPCAECRHEDYMRFTSRWQGIHPQLRGADAIDAQLHAERLEPGGKRQRHHLAPLEGLPDGSFVLRRDAPFMVKGSRLWRWTPGGYVEPLARGRGTVTVITPPSLVAVLNAGWETSVPLFHPTAEPAHR